VRDNERYLAFSPAVSQAFLVHSSEVRHKIVGQKKVTLEHKSLTFWCTSVIFLLYFCFILFHILDLNVFSNIQSLGTR
jgi:hypothetical protein